MKLEPGEVICPDCSGGKEIWFCPRCLGTGKLDWLEMCMGKSVDWVKMSKRPYTSITLPIVRHMYPKLIAEEIVSIQPIDWSEKNGT